MDHELICTWLGLPSNCWPPDHYTLLGLQPGEVDGARIEQQVHERLARLRRYQISHPGPATEAMNRLAQAFLCLTEPQARQAYDAQFFPHLAARPAPPSPAQPAPPPAVPAVATLPPTPADTPVPAAPKGVGPDTAVVQPVRTQLDWRSVTPPPVRNLVLPPVAPVNGTGHADSAASANGAVPAESAPPPAAIPSLETLAPVSAGAAPPQAPPVTPTTVPQGRPADPVYETARSVEARRGLRTRRDLLERVRLTRRLLRAWERIGKYVGKPRRKLAKPSEEQELTRLLERIDQSLESFPPLLGQPGQPGYRVLAMAQDDEPVPMFNRQDADEREALARDWLAGQALLRSHRQFLRDEVRGLRRRALPARLLYPVRAVLNDHASWVYLGLALVGGAFLAVLLLR